MRKNLILIFCCIFLSQSVSSVGKTVEAQAEHVMEPEYETLAPGESSQRYLIIYINGQSSMKVDILLILECVILIFIIALEKTR